VGLKRCQWETLQGKEWDNVKVGKAANQEEKRITIITIVIIVKAMIKMPGRTSTPQ